MPASRRRVRGFAIASAAGAWKASAVTTGGRRLRRRRTRGATTPTATAPHAIVRRARELLLSEAPGLAGCARGGLKAPPRIKLGGGGFFGDRSRHQLFRWRDLDAQHAHPALQCPVGVAVDLG